jgi:cytochrome c-type biogenesis protein CcmF
MIEYIGEHAWAGQLGHSLTIISFVGAVLAALAYLIGTQRNDDGWKSLGRLAFRVHSVAVLGIVVVLFTMLFKHWFGYDYVWKHSNLQMPMKYIASCFWEGQEGSYLLWTFWHVVLGNILIWRAGKWEAPVMTVFASVQIFLAMMLLGIYVGDVRIGSSPFLLIRELPENLGLPWTIAPDYLQRIPQFADGRGLNPLLQNYWMVIHPPTLFLGFAATLVPFAYAIAGLWTGQRKEWMTPALPWTFFGVMILGTGILMGGAWAYEALSFGGFWAWDPVENASLVPWLTLVGAGHLMLVNKRKETSLFTAFFLALISFILVLYSTFLTRSGVLGDTSVHSFTGDGMLPGLLLFLLFFIGLSVMMLVPDKGQRRFYALISFALLAIGVLLEVEVGAILLFAALSIAMLVQAYRKGFSSSDPEEALWSREFWMFIGSLVLLLSAAQITFSTSVPVFNLLLKPFGELFASLGERTGSSFLTGLSDAQLAPPGDAIAHYNKWQLPFAFIVSMLVAFTQYLRWKNSDMKKFRRDLLLSVVIAVVLTGLGTWMLGYKVTQMQYIALLFATAFATVSNLLYIPKILKGRLKNAGPSVAHVGFALVLLGALVSTGNKEEVSQNTKGMDLRFLNEGFSNSSDILLYRGDTVRMGEFYVHYRAKEEEGINLNYRMDYFAVEPRDFRTGDTVRVGDMLFVARTDHRATAVFLVDQPNNWEPIEEYTKRELWYAKEWSHTRPGEFLFELSPFVQLNERMGNVAEPSTKHWLHRDLYTHIRYGDLSTESDSIAEGWMPDRLYEKTIGDTIVTPSSIVIIDSVYTVSDSATKAMLGERYTVYAAKLRIRDLYRTDRWFDARPLVIYADGEAVAGKAAELEALRMRYGLATVVGDLNDQQGLKLGINVAEAEFVVMQALVFPGINILWLGCVLLALGSGMAVWQRVRNSKTTSA